MGEIADGLVNGDFDFYTGEYIGRGHGYLRTKNKSLDWEKGNNKSQMRGVVKFVQKRLKVDDASPFINEYIPEKMKFIDKCVKISNDFIPFSNWIAQKLKDRKQ